MTLVLTLLAANVRFRDCFYRSFVRTTVLLLQRSVCRCITEHHERRVHHRVVEDFAPLVSKQCISEAAFKALTPGDETELKLVIKRGCSPPLPQSKQHKTRCKEPKAHSGH